MCLSYDRALRAMFQNVKLAGKRAHHMSTAALILAAGHGTRAGGSHAKQWQTLAGEPLIAHTLRAFHGQVDHIVLVIRPEDSAQAAKLGAEITFGGAARADSVRGALEHLADKGISKVLIHDGARPFVTPALIGRVLDALKRCDGAAPAVPVTDALWRGGDLVEDTVERAGLWRAQTPQGFDFNAILAAHRAYQGDAADDVEVARAAGLSVAIVQGESDNLKITFREDFARAESMLKGFAMDMRIGNGFDVHAFTAGDHLWLCGVKLAHERALLGHSDADVGMHALSDALYGALAEGDIGQHFPPCDTRWKDASSSVFLRHAMERVRTRGYKLANCDITLICERPKIGPHQEAMRQALAAIMQVETAQISVKATTSEKLGFTGREEGIAAMASAALVRA